MGSVTKDATGLKTPESTFSSNTLFEGAGASKLDSLDTRALKPDSVIGVSKPDSGTRASKHLGTGASKPNSLGTGASKHLGTRASKPDSLDTSASKLILSEGDPDQNNISNCESQVETNQ